jgi:hypothetical protein
MLEYVSTQEKKINPQCFAEEGALIPLVVDLVHLTLNGLHYYDYGPYVPTHYLSRGGIF